ncbi:hypothetical protein [Dyadobacter bucti]|uniref:hypothetical protein n=1 Tax=Dyadobacter bucti TaxID=2572203 RepID=UPI003F71DF5F
MINVETALALFGGRDEIQKEIGIDDEKWEDEIGPSLVFLEKQNLVLLLYSHQAEYPIYAELTTAGKKRRNSTQPSNKIKLITAEDKDVILTHLVNNYSVGGWVALPIDQPIHGLSGDQLDAVLSNFGQHNLIDYSGYTTMDRGHVEFVMRVESHDFIQQGGFFGRYELFQKTVEKLLMEVEKLEREEGGRENKFSEYKEKIKEYAGIISTATTIVESIKNTLE